MLGKFVKTIEQVVPLLTFYPRWTQYLFTLTFILLLCSIFVFVVYYTTATKKRESSTVTTQDTNYSSKKEIGSAILTPDNIDSVIDKVKAYSLHLQAIRDSMNKGGKVSQEQLSSFRVDYERSIRPFVLALNMNEAGEKDWHGYKLKYDNPVDLATKEFTFFHVNLALRYLSSVIGRLEHLKEHPEMINKASNKAN